MKITDEEILTKLNKLVEFKTVAGKPNEQNRCLDYIEKEFSFHPFYKKRYLAGGYPSLVFLTKKTKRPAIFLAAHIDVVPAPAPMFKLKKNGDKIYGRGASDMKFAIVSYIIALKNLYEEYKRLPSLGLMFTSEEEIKGNNGVGFLLSEKGYSCEAAFLPDGGENWHIIKEEKGLLHLKLKIKGKGAHGSRPWEGESAISKLFAFGGKLEDIYPSGGKGWGITVNFGKISGGKAINQVAAEASVWLDFRYPPQDSVEKILSRLRSLLPEAEMEIIDEIPAFFADPENPFVKRWAKIIGGKQKGKLFIREEGSSDGPFFSEKNIPAIISKPICGGGHSEKEWISLASLKEYTGCLETFLKKLF